MIGCGWVGQYLRQRKEGAFSGIDLTVEQLDLKEFDSGGN